ncbi:MAG: folate-binding protein [Candidatus Liberibacter europaeus]|uniref:Folate-binding protein n=1 Tax=Candidatus Liberibacter europaeus TaxID=744859 RepID=A0A2T4VYE3_9HYPH|nr:folate-binding protein [Candidatus Liberibacter europaeus]PTL86793.1 MAG: folate-binding protein [Candidatus Liberibacter europaeus]
MPSICLPNKSFIKVSGSAAQTFLQGIITADVNTIPYEVARGSALLTPQGKILFYFLISKIEENIFLLEIDDNKCCDLVEKLILYKLRMDVIIEVQKIRGVTLSWNQENPLNTPSFIDERFLIAGVKLWRTQECTADYASDSESYYKLRVNHGIVDPNIDFPSSTIFPHDIWMDTLKGVSFTKGCYIGQEVVSRIQHRHSIRKRSIIIKGDKDLPNGNLPLIVNNKKIGTLGIVMENKAIAISRIDKLEEAMKLNLPITVNDIEIVPIFPSWKDENLLNKK